MGYINGIRVISEKSCRSNMFENRTEEEVATDRAYMNSCNVSSNGFDNDSTCCGSNNNRYDNANIIYRGSINLSENPTNGCISANNTCSIDDSASAQCDNDACDCGCNCNCNCSNNDDWTCAKADNCCSGDVNIFDPSRVRCVCTYMDIIFGEETVQGSPLLYNINTSSISNYTVTSDYKSIDPLCCTPCIIDTTSQFKVESVKVLIKNFVPNEDVLTNATINVNGSTVPFSLTYQGILNAMIPKLLLDASCSNCGKGTNVSVLLNSVQPWNLLAEIDLCGTVKTGSTTCMFKVVFSDNLMGEIVTLPSAFLAPNLCIPDINSTDSIGLNIKFNAIGQLIAPVLTATLSDVSNPSSPVVLNLSGNMLLSPSADMQVMQNTKVCFNAMI